MAAYMKKNISNSVKEVIIVWNRRYKDPMKQILDLMLIFKSLSNAPGLPRQMLMNKEFELDRVLRTKPLIKALERFQKTANKTYQTLFEYSSLIIGSKQGSMNDAYRELLKDMKYVVSDYNRLAQVANKEYRQKVMPYFKLDYKKR
jgi:hypothetical protein